MITPPFQTLNSHYFYQTLSGQGWLKTSSYTLVFVYCGNISIASSKGNERAERGDCLEWSSGCSVEYSCSKGAQIVCVCSNKAGDILETDGEDKPRCFNAQDSGYHVLKPWGREIWLTGSSAQNNVVLKYIEIKKGTKTSLQVHIKKYETNFIVSGSAVVRTSPVQFTQREAVYPLEEWAINSPQALDVAPLTVHQVEAISDICLIEASTTHLDDVIRLQDDSGRADGRIEEEHEIGK